MIDTTLLASKEPISMEALQAFFQANDFSTMVSRYDAERATEENNAFYLKVKQIFRDAWNKEMGALTKKNSLMNFSEFYPIRCLEDREEDLISGTVMELLAEDDLCGQLFDSVFDSMQEHLHTALKTHATAQNKSVDALTEEEIAFVVNQFAETFEPHDKEHFFGMGHSWDNAFDLKGTSIDIRNINAKCTIPYVYSSLGYGFLWNVPSTGSCELANNRTRFSSDCCHGIDYVVIGGNPKECTSVLADLTGHAPRMPQWATGFWQSRLRHESQEELLSVARRYQALGIPLSAIVCDYFHWTEQGDYRFDPQYWPDVKAMTRELHQMGTKLIVSVWPTINENSENYQHMLESNMLMRTVHGSDRVFNFYGWQAEIDVTNPDTRAYVWSKLKGNYIDNGVDALWFDEAEPEIHPEQFDNLIWHKGRADKVALLYPYYYSKMAYEGFQSLGREDIITLTRCAYFGSQKYASLVWSGDIPSTFESLSHQVKAGLNMAMCGIPWWNTDIGGFYGGDIQSDVFRELIVRWFQFGVFSPVMRLHGSRIRHSAATPGLLEPSGDPNEIWCFGEENCKILTQLILLREKLRPYIRQQMETASEKGYPVMRPMFFHYPEDEICYTLDSQYFFGDDIIFAPIVNRGQREKRVYIPDDQWVLTRNGENYSKGWHTVTAGIDEFVAFVRKNAQVQTCFQ